MRPVGSSHLKRGRGFPAHSTPPPPCSSTECTGACVQALGADEVRRRSQLEDKPLRMVKTLLHELCKLRGHAIYEDVDNMPGGSRARELHPCRDADSGLVLQQGVQP